MTNPQIAIDSILETEQTIAGVDIKPITAARYALLELVDSPFVNPEKTFTISNLIPSLYICSADIKNLKGFNSKNIDKLDEAALEWSETIDLDKVGPAVEILLQKFNDLFKIAPGTGSTEEKKKV